MRGHHHRRRSRARRSVDGQWEVQARLERFAEPAALLLLRERPLHGYELLELLPPLVGEQRVDVGNLYRFLRALEEDGVVTSQWSADLPGPAKRTTHSPTRAARCSTPGRPRSATRANASRPFSTATPKERG